MKNMKWLKKIALGFLFILLCNLILILSISLNLKNMIIDEIIVETITEKITNKTYEAENELVLDENLINDERVKAILESREAQELIDKYLDIFIDSIVNDEDFNELEIEKDFLEYLRENKDTLEKIIGQEITEEMINETEKQLESKDFTKSFQQTIDSTKKVITSSEKTVIRGYQLMTSFWFQFTLSCLICVTVILICFLQKSFFEGIKTLGKALITSSIFLFLICFIVEFIVENLSQMQNFRLSSLWKTGIVIFIFGILFFVFYSLILKVRKKSHEIS